ncbi:MAG: DsbA family protein [Hyphomicrobiaceae bacterium]
MSDDEETKRHLVYVGDPMCSWCYGFAPVMEGLVDHFGDRLPIGLVMGGLRAGNKSPMTDADKRSIASHWVKVREATGQPFDFELLERDGFVYDTEPACRAVVTMRLLNPPLALAYQGRIQRAFYAQNQDTTDEEVLADVAGEAGVDSDLFLQEMRSAEAKNATFRDFLTAQEAQIRSFPTLLAGDGAGNYLVVANGYRPLEGLQEALEKWLES